MRKNIPGYKTCNNVFFGKIICGDCGGFYGRKVWHSNNEKYRRTVWQCNNKYEGEEKFITPHVYEQNIKEAFIKEFNYMLTDKERILAGYREAIREFLNTDATEAEILRLQLEINGTAELIRECVEENAKKAIDQSLYQKKHSRLSG